MAERARPALVVPAEDDDEAEGERIGDSSPWATPPLYLSLGFCLLPSSTRRTFLRPERTPPHL